MDQVFNLWCLDIMVMGALEISSYLPSLRLYRPTAETPIDSRKNFTRVMTSGLGPLHLQDYMIYIVFEVVLLVFMSLSTKLR